VEQFQSVGNGKLGVAGEASLDFVASRESHWCSIFEALLLRGGSGGWSIFRGQWLLREGSGGCIVFRFLLVGGGSECSRVYHLGWASARPRHPNIGRSRTSRRLSFEGRWRPMEDLFKSLSRP